MTGPGQGRPQRGPQLPYKLLAGVEPCTGGWLVVTGRLQGTNLAPQQPEVFPTLIDVLDYKPAFTIIALHAPVGLPEGPGGRAADRAARAVLGPRRAPAVVFPPARAALEAKTFEEAKELDPKINTVTWRLIRRMAESAAELAPYWQRTVFEVNPELAFYGLNGDEPLRFAKRSIVGAKERRVLLEERFPGIDVTLDTKVPGVRQDRVIDAAADLWTARRIAARALNRLPEDPEWDEEGLRMEIVY
jgi:predicted RNase H-like nuclease